MKTAKYRTNYIYFFNTLECWSLPVPLKIKPKILIFCDKCINVRNQWINGNMNHLQLFPSESIFIFLLFIYWMTASYYFHIVRILNLHIKHSLSLYILSSIFNWHKCCGPGHSEIYYLWYIFMLYFMHGLWKESYDNR